MKVIKKSMYNNEGIYINLDTSFQPYENLLSNHKKHLNHNCKYFIYCEKGTKSRKVVAILEAYGYDVTQVVN